MTVRDTIQGDQVVCEHAGAAFEEESRSYPAQMEGGKGSAVTEGWIETVVNPARDGPQTMVKRAARGGAPLEALAERSKSF